MKIYNSTHSFNTSKDYNPNIDILKSISVVKNEEFGFFVSFDVKEKSYVCLNSHYDLPWWGLDNRYRFEILNDSQNGSNISCNLCSYIKDDNGIFYADMINDEPSSYYENVSVPIYISGKISTGFSNNFINLRFNLYKNNNYNAEELVESMDFSIKIINFSLQKNDELFFLDLWQHPCSLARTHGLTYFSEEHFSLIEKYIKSLSELGQKVIDLIVSDFPWAGQSCFNIEKNASRLYEYNIIKVFKENKSLKLDFNALDRYVELCLKYGIKDEINLFGLCGNWHGKDFSSPLIDYKDPIRISLYDKDKRCYDYIRTKDELKEYIYLLFKHLEDKNYFKLCKVIGDEPNNIELFTEFQDFLSSCYPKNISFKYALHSSTFLDNYKGDFESFSINSAYLSPYIKNGKLVGILKENSHKMTWYPCCFPKKLNTFISSPLIESRYLGLYTYLWEFKGMLRWAYNLYTQEPCSNISYKPEKWKAGDMFFVYPSKNMNINHSIREKNMLFSIQDFNIFKRLEREGLKPLEVLKDKLNIKLLADNINGELVLDEYQSYEYYKQIRDDLIRSKYEN